MLPFFAFALPILVLLCGLLLDVSLMENQSLAMQNAADAASFGAELEQERGNPAFGSVVQSIASLNGFTDGSAGTTISAVQGPATGAFAGDSDAIEVIITRPAQSIFMKYLNSPVVAVRSVSLIPPCVFLNGSSAGAAALSATSSSANFSCPVSSSGSLTLDGSSSLVATAWNLAGDSGSVSGGGTLAPAPRSNAKPPAADPLAALVAPGAGSCTASNFAQKGGSATLHPGVYCNGLTLANTSVTLTPGLYIVTGGAHWSNAQVQGTGVTLLLTQGGGAAFGQFVIDSSSKVSLSAPVDASAGALPGILLFADRQWAPTSAFDLQIRNSTVLADGVFYAARTGLSLTGSTLRPMKYLGFNIAALSLASSQLAASGNFSSVSTGSPFRPIGGNVE